MTPVHDLPSLYGRTLSISLTKGEVKSLNAGIKEFDFKGSVYDWTFLPDELIEPGLSNFAGAVRGGIQSTIVAGSGAIQSHEEANGLTVFRGSQHQVQVAAVEPEHNLARRRLKHRAFGIDVPRPAQSPMIQRRFRGRCECLDESLRTRSGEAKFSAWR